MHRSTYTYIEVDQPRSQALSPGNEVGSRYGTNV